MPKIEVGSNLINYDVRGEGTAAILFNHSGASSLGWSERFLETLAEEFTTVTPDYRGTGRSSPASTAFTLADLAADGYAVLKAEHLDTAVVVGTSMGGAVAQEYALAFPEHVSALVLMGTMAGQKHLVPPEPSVLELLRLPEEISLLERWRRLLPTIYSRSFLEKHEDLALELELKGIRFTTQETIAGHSDAVSGFELYEQLESIGVPALIIHGSEDPIIPVENGRILAGRIPGSEYVELEGVGHLPAVERPFEVADYILSFTRRNGIAAFASAV